MCVCAVYVSPLLGDREVIVYVQGPQAVRLVCYQRLIRHGSDAAVIFYFLLNFSVFEMIKICPTL